jgi:large subunit ribosomal protein L21
MFAILKTGGKQYKVSAGEVIQTEKLDVEAGREAELSEVLAICDGDQTIIGSPFIHGAKVVVAVLEQKRDRKILVFKKIRRHNHRRKNGHRQWKSVLKIKEIVTP